MWRHKRGCQKQRLLPRLFADDFAGTLDRPIRQMEMIGELPRFCGPTIEGDAVAFHAAAVGRVFRQPPRMVIIVNVVGAEHLGLVTVTARIRRLVHVPARQRRAVTGIA